MMGIRRAKRDRWISGVCGGIAHRYGWNSNMVRLVVVLLAIFIPGPERARDPGLRAPRLPAPRGGVLAGGLRRGPERGALLPQVRPAVPGAHEGRLRRGTAERRPLYRGGGARLQRGPRRRAVPRGLGDAARPPALLRGVGARRGLPDHAREVQDHRRVVPPSRRRSTRAGRTFSPNSPPWTRRWWWRWGIWSAGR
jgi:hypothetical protein